MKKNIDTIFDLKIFESVYLLIQIIINYKL